MIVVIYRDNPVSVSGERLDQSWTTGIWEGGMVMVMRRGDAQMFGFHVGVDIRFLF